VLTAALGETAPELLDEWTFSNLNVSLRSDATAVSVRAAMREARSRFGDDLAGVVPEVSEQALKKLKFSELLPPHLAMQTLAARGADWQGAAAVARWPIHEAMTIAD
jgi:ATP-dependent Lhr-like helicase